MSESEEMINVVTENDDELLPHVPATRPRTPVSPLSPLGLPPPPALPYPEGSFAEDDEMQADEEFRVRPPPPPATHHPLVAVSLERSAFLSDDGIEPRQRRSDSTTSSQYTYTWESAPSSLDGGDGSRPRSRSSSLSSSGSYHERMIQRDVNSRQKRRVMVKKKREASQSRMGMATTTPEASSEGWRPSTEGSMSLSRSGKREKEKQEKAREPSFLFGEEGALPPREENCSIVFSRDLKTIRKCRAMLDREDSADATDAPVVLGPFIADILSIILLFIQKRDLNMLLAVSSVCHHWRYVSNYLPHWTALATSRRFYWIADKTFIGTRDEVMGARHEFDENTRAKRWRLRVLKARRYAVTTFIPVLVFAALMICHWNIAWYLGRSRTQLSNDAFVGVALFFTFCLCLLLEAAFITYVGREDGRHVAAKKLMLFLVLSLTSFIILMPLALVSARVSTADEIFDRGSISLSQASQLPCISTENPPSFVNLPAPLSDTDAWTPIVLPGMRKSAVGYGNLSCISESAVCFVLLQYVQENRTTNEYFNLCAAPVRPAIVAVASPLGESNVTMPLSLSDSLNYRSVAEFYWFGTEDFRRHAEQWYSSQNHLWSGSRVMLIQPKFQDGFALLETEQHFFDEYEKVLRILFGILLFFGVLFGIATSRKSVMITYTIVLGVHFVAINPLTLLIVGGLCLAGEPAKPKAFMCSPESGRMMMGIAIAVSLVILFTYCRRR